VALRRRGLDTGNLRAVAGASAAVVTLVQAVTATVALRRGRPDYADAVWGPGLAAISLVAATVGRGDARRRWALAAVTTGWAVRLEKQMVGRMAGTDEVDPRYVEFLDGASTPTVLAKVFLTQGLSQLVVSLPLQLAAASTLPRSSRRWLAPAGIAVMVGGAVVEALADRQKDRFTAADDGDFQGGAKPDVLDTGLWGLSRHPNYLGDSIVWDGAYLAAAASSPAAWALPAPALMSYILMFATGARRTEKHMQDRPGYADYQQRVPFFFPRPLATP
jgi:steroid 5-alpha reductase family enzyme